MAEEKTNKRFDGVNTDPFAEVQLKQIFNNGRATDKWLTEMRDEQGEWRELAGTGTVHSENYRLVSNRQVHDLMTAAISKVAGSGVEFNPIPAFPGSTTGPVNWTGKRFVERWYTKDVAIQPNDGGQVFLGVEARNSYDGDCKVKIGFFSMHVVCNNQFTSNHLLGQPFTLPHTTAVPDLDENIDEVIRIVASKAATFGQTLGSINKLCDFKFSSPMHRDEFLNECELKTGLVFNDRKIRLELAGRGITSQIPELNLGNKFYADPTSMYGLLQAVSAVNTHDCPGLGGAEKTSRFLDFAIEYSA